jgi:hypothetical protein
MNSSPWSKDAPPPQTTGPAPPWWPPAASAGPASAGRVPAEAPGPRRRSWVAPALRFLLTVVVAAAVGSAVAFFGMHSDHAGSPAMQPSAAPTPPATAASAAAAKQNICHIYDVSVGRGGHGGYRVEGNLNLPVVLQAVTSAVAVQNALVPAVPPDVAAAARNYVNTTLDAVTAAMGDSTISEINRLTHRSNDAVDALLDACGLPR